MTEGEDIWDDELPGDEDEEEEEEENVRYAGEGDDSDIPMRQLTLTDNQLAESFIDDLHKKFPGGTPSRFLHLQVKDEDGTWYYKTSGLRGGKLR